MNRISRSKTAMANHRWWQAHNYQNLWWTALTKRCHLISKQTNMAALSTAGTHQWQRVTSSIWIGLLLELVSRCSMIKARLFIQFLKHMANHNLEVKAYLKEHHNQTPRSKITQLYFNRMSDHPIRILKGLEKSLRSLDNLLCQVELVRYLEVSSQ